MNDQPVSRRVLYIEGNEDGTVGGSHKIQADLVTHLSPAYEPVLMHYQENPWAQRMRDRGLEVHVWDDVRREELASFHTGSRARTALALGRAIGRRRTFLRAHRIDVVHLNNSPWRGHDDWLPAARLERIPCTVYAMGDARRHPSAFRRFLMRRFDMVFPLSRLVEESLLENGISPARIVLTYPGVDVAELAARTHRPAAEVRAELGVTDGQVMAVMVGNVRRWKGQHVVVEAVAALPPDVRARLVVLLVGESGPGHAAYGESIREMIVDAGLEDTVRMLGRREDVPDLLEAADIAVHASVRPEPFGLVVQEGMLHGCAPIAANAGGPVEMITAESGLLFDPSNPAELTGLLDALIRDPERRRRLAERARERASEFDIGRHVRLIEEAYGRLLRRAAPVA